MPRCRTVLQAVALALAAAVAGCGGDNAAPPPSAAANANATQVTLTVNPEPPARPGTAIRLSATGKGGTEPYSYKWFVSPDAGQRWDQLQDWSPASTHEWTPPAAGSYLVSVWIRSAGNTADEREDATSTSVAVTP
jgi:hypothetical protein